MINEKWLSAKNIWEELSSQIGYVRERLAKFISHIPDMPAAAEKEYAKHYKHPDSMEVAQ